MLQAKLISIRLMDLKRSNKGFQGYCLAFEAAFEELQLSYIRPEKCILLPSHQPFIGDARASLL